jgi:hypothetical protein
MSITLCKNHSVYVICKYQVMLHNITGCVDPLVILGGEEDGV